MAEEPRSMTYDYTDPDTKKQYTVFPTDGTPRTEVQFEEATWQFEQPGEQRFTVPTGFTILPKGSLTEKLRRGYETVNQPLQAVLNTPPPKNAVLRAVTAPGEAINRYLGEQVNTPEKLGSTAALTAVGVGPIGKVLKNTSGIIPSLVRAGAAGLGALTASKLTGSAEGEGAKTPIMERATIQALMTVPSTLVSEGIVSVLTGGLSAKAGKQVVDDITSAIRKDAPHLTYGGKAGIDEYVKSQGNFTNVINAGIKGMKADGDELAKSFLSDLKQTGIQITKKTSTLVERMLKQYNDTVVTMLDDIGNDKLRNSSMTKINEITGEIKDLIVESLGPPGTVAAPYIAKLEQTMMKYGAAQQKFKALAEVFSVLKQSNTAGGLNPQRLQEVIADRVKGSTTYQSALSKDVMSAASRGAPHGSVDYSGIDVNKVADMLPGIAGAPIKAASRVTGFNKIPVGATYHVGTIKGVPNKAAFDAMTQDEIRKFLFRTSKEKE